MLKIINRLVSTSFFLVTLTSGHLCGMSVVALNAEQLYEAATKGDIVGIKKYLNAGGDINAKYSGYPALMTTVLYGHTDAYYFLLEHKANPNAQDLLGRTALFLDKCDTKMFKAALEAGANPNIQNNNGNTLLITIIKDKCTSDMPYRIALLFKHGARADIADARGNTAMDYATSDWLKELVAMDKVKQDQVIARYETHLSRRV